ncbi:MAG: hypothetical protein AAB250_07895 [Bdellovibrionota bacterium]
MAEPDKPNSRPSAPDRIPKRPEVGEPARSHDNPPEVDPTVYEPERKLPPDPEGDPDTAGHDLEVEGP